MVLLIRSSQKFTAAQFTFGMCGRKINTKLNSLQYKYKNRMARKHKNDLKDDTGFNKKTHATLYT